MSNKNTILKQIFKERKIEIQLKDYLKKMNECFGEDYTSLIFSSEKRPSESLQLFTKKYPDVSDTDIVLLLIRGAVVSDEENYQNLFIQDLIENGDMEDIMNLVYSNLSLRKMLTRTLIHVSYGSNFDFYQKKRKEDNTIDKLLTLQYFQESIPSSNIQKKKM